MSHNGVKSGARSALAKCAVGARLAPLVTSCCATLRKGRAGFWRGTRSCSTAWPSDQVAKPGRVFLAGRGGDWCRRVHVGQGQPTRARGLRSGPGAGFGGEDFYPDLIDKAAVLTYRLAWNDPLVDGNKRAAWAALVMFLDLKGFVWHPDPPAVGEAEAAMMAVAAHEVDENWLVAWLRERVQAAS